MGRVYLNEPLALGAHPTTTVGRAAAREDERVGSVLINDGKFEIKVVWRDINRLPFH
jgi:hypothetical protein